VASDKPQEPQQPYDWSAIQSSAPSLADKMTDPSFAEAAKNDVPHLAQVEASVRDNDPGFLRWVTGRLLKSPRDVLVDTPVEGFKDLGDAAKNFYDDTTQSFQAGRQAAPLYNLRAKQVLGNASPEEDVQADKLSATLRSNPFKSRYSGFAQEIPSETAKMAGGLVGNGRQIGGRVVVGTGMGVALGAGAGLLAGGVGAVPGALTGAKVGFSVSMTAAMAEQMATQTMGQFYDDMLNTKLPDGTKVDPQVARGAALVLGAVNGGIGVLPLGGILSKGGLTPKLLGPAGARFMQSLMLREGVAPLLARVALKFGTAEATQAITGAVQELTTMGAEQYVSHGQLPFDLSRIPAAAAKTAQGGAGFSALEAGLHLGGRQQALADHMQETARAVATYDNFGDVARDATVFQTDKTHLRDFASRLAEANKLKDVTFPRGKLMEFLKGERMMPDLEKVLPDVAKQLQESAGDDKAEIRLSPADVAAYLAPSKNFKALRADLRDGNSFTLRELNEFAKESNKPPEMPKAAEVPANIQGIYNDARGQFKQFGEGVAENTATIYTAGVEALADAIGAKPEEIHGRWGLQVVKKLAAQLDERKAGIPGESVADASKYKLLDVNEKVPANDINSSNFLNDLRSMVADREKKSGVKSASQAKPGTWGEVFDLLTKTTGDQHGAASVLARMGWDGLVMPGQNFVWHPDVMLPQRDPFSRVKGATKFEAGKTTMAFTPEADIGTVVHEMGHLFLQMWGDAAKSAPHPGVAETVELHRGTRGADPKAAGDGGVRFLTPDRALAEAYANGEAVTSPTQGTPKVHTENVTFNRLLKGDSFEALRDRLGLEAPAPMRDVIKAAKEAGYDGMSFKSAKGVEYVDLMQKPTDAPDSPAARDFAAIEKFTGGDPEKFANAFVDYLRFGKSPSPKLNSAFGKFKGWLTAVYGTQTALGAPVPAEVSAVMDRMLASRQAVTEVTKSLIDPMFTRPEDLGGSETKLARYKKMLDDAAATAENELDRQLLSHISGEGLRKFEEMKESVRDELIATDSTHSLVSYLKDGERLDGGPHPVDEGKLSTEALKSLGADSELLKKMEGMTGGEADPENVARAFGFTDAPEMLQALRDHEPLDAAVAKTAAARMPGWVDPELWARDRALAKMSDVVPQVLMAEYAAVGGVQHQGALEVFKSIARRDIKARKVSSLVPEHFLAEYKRLGEEARKAFHGQAELQDLAEKGKNKPGMSGEDFLKAKAARDRAAALSEDIKGLDPVSLKRRQIVEFLRWREARQGLEDQAKLSAQALQLRDDVTLQDRLARPGPEHLEAVQSALAAYGFADYDPNRKPIGEYVDDQLKNNADLVVDPELEFREKSRTNVQDFTVGQMQAARDFLTSLKHHIEQLDEFHGGPTPKPLDPLVTALAQHIKTRWPTIDRTERNLALRKLTSLGRALLADTARAEGILRTLDGDPHGLLAQTLFQPLVKAEGERTAMLKLLRDAMGGIMEEVTGKDRSWLAEKTDFQTRDVSTHDPLTNERVLVPRRKLYKSELLALLLNYGSESNRRAAQNGLGLKHEEILKAFETHLPAKAAVIANRMWQLMDAVFPEVQKTYRSRTGTDLGSIKASPFTLALGGEQVALDGGYWPKKYAKEALHTHDNVRFGAEDFNSMDVEDSFTEHRTDAFGPLELSLPVVLNHLHRKIHYATMYGPVQEANKIISHPEFKRAINDTIGPEYNKTFSDMLRNIARDGLPDAPLSAWDKVMRWSMVGAQQMALGLNSKTALMQHVGLIPAAKDVSPVHWGPAWRDVLTDWKGTWEKAEAESNELSRIDINLKDARWKVLLPDVTLSPSIETQMKTLGHGKLFTSASEVQNYLQQLGMSHIAASQKLVNLVTFLGAKSQAIADGRPDPVAYADAVIRQSQGGHGLKDLPNIIAKPGMARSTVMFYSYMSVVADQMISAGMNMDKSIRTGQAISKDTLLKTVGPLVAFVLAPATAQMFIEQSWKDKPDSMDDVSWFMRSQIATMMTRPVPVVGDALGTMFAPDLPGRGHLGGPLGQLSGSVRNFELGFVDEKDKIDMVAAAAKLSSFIMHVPTNHLYQGVNFWYNFLQGRYGDPAKAYGVYVRGEKKEGIR
jgi:hypothetical protein